MENQQKDIESWKKYCDEQENDITLKNNKICDLEFKIEKQQKELEDLKDIQQQICNEELISQEYVKENYIHIDKIKAKIEEIDEVLKGKLIEKIRVYFEAQKEVLQELLEKE